MKTLALLLAGALALASLPAAAHPHVTVGLGFGFPFRYYAPYAYSPWVYPYPAAPYAVPVPVPVAPAEKPAADLYVYPEAGQNADQVSRDRTQCHDWAAGESAYDPQAVKRQKADDLANYDRAFTACMEGRNYSVG
jgi:hypothetical protein